MSPYLAHKSRNLVDALLMSADDIGWDSERQLIVDGRVYYGTDIVRLIAYVMSPDDTDFEEPMGLKVFIAALERIGLESDYVVNHHVKRALRKHNVSDNEDNETSNEFDDDSTDENEDDDDDDDDDDDSNNTSCDSENNIDSNDGEDYNKDMTDEESDYSTVSKRSETKISKYHWKSVSDSDSKDEMTDEESNTNTRLKKGGTRTLKYYSVTDSNDGNDPDEQMMDEESDSSAGSKRRRVKYNWKSVSDTDSER